MARGVKIEKVYSGKALKISEKIQKLEIEIKSAKDELKVAYKEQLKEEKLTAAKAKKDAELATKKLMKENKEKLLKAIQDSGKSPDEIIELLKK